jgi:hypothetical protein
MRRVTLLAYLLLSVVCVASCASTPSKAPAWHYRVVDQPYSPEPSEQQTQPQPDYQKLLNEIHATRDAVYSKGRTLTDAGQALAAAQNSEAKACQLAEGAVLRHPSKRCRDSISAVYDAWRNKGVAAVAAMKAWKNLVQGWVKDLEEYGFPEVPHALLDADLGTFDATGDSHISYWTCYAGMVTPADLAGCLQQDNPRGDLANDYGVLYKQVASMSDEQQRIWRDRAQTRTNLLLQHYEAELLQQQQNRSTQCLSVPVGRGSYTNCR